MKKGLFNLFQFLIALIGWGGHGIMAQNRVDVTLKYNSTTSQYEVYARPNFTNPSFGVGAGTQISIVLPASIPNNALTIGQVTGGGGPWSDASQVYAPVADPARDYHGIATNGSYFNAVAGQELLLFTFSIAGACNLGIRLFENATDPSSSAAGFSGGDYKNYIGDALNFGNDVYRGNYTSPNGLCGTPPLVGFTSPVDGSKTTTSPPVTGTATPGASVTVGEGGGVICIITANSSGNWSCPSLTPFSTGLHTLTAIASNTFGTSPTATTSFTVIPPPTVAINTPAPSTTTTTSPVITGTATPGSSVTVGENGTTLCTTMASTSGAWSCSGITFPTGPHTVTAVTSNEGGTSGPATTNFTVIGPPTIAILTPPTGSTTTSPTPPVTGTATPGANVTVGENGTTLCTTTASTGGAWSCSGITFPTGPHTVTAIASNPGGTSPMVTTNFTVVTPVTLPTTLTAGPGSVFNDLNGNCTADAGENLTGLPTPLYAKLVSLATPTVAQQAVSVAPDGSFSFAGLANGSYTVIIDDNLTTSDVTPLTGYSNTSRGTYVANNGVVTAPAQAQFCLQSTCPPFTLPSLSK